MKQTSLFLVTAFAGGLSLFAQTPPPPAGQPGTPGMHGPPRPRGGDPARRNPLNLTEAQLTQHKQIFSDERTQAKPVEEQLRKVRETLDQAIRGGSSESNIDLLADQVGPLMAQLEKIHAKARAKYVATLTPDQKGKYDEMATRHRGPGPGGPGGPSGRPMPRPGPGAPPQI